MEKTVVTESGHEIDGRKLKKQIAAVEVLEEERVELNQKFAERYGIIKDAGFDKKIIKAVVGRRKKDRDKVQAGDLLIHHYEVALGMRTMDLPFGEQQTAADGAEATEQALEPQTTLTESDKAEEDEEVKPGAKSKTAKEQAKTPAAPASNTTDLEAEYEFGRQAKIAGQPRSTCPHKKRTKLFKTWTNGWDDAANEQGEEPEPDVPDTAEVHEGRKAFDEGLAENKNPYKARTVKNVHWILGWNQRAGEDKVAADTEEVADQAEPETAPGYQDKTERMSAETFKEQTGAEF